MKARTTVGEARRIIDKAIDNYHGEADVVFVYVFPDFGEELVCVEPQWECDIPADKLLEHLTVRSLRLADENGLGICVSGYVDIRQEGKN